MDKTGFLATLGKDFLDPSLFAEAFCGPDELDLKSGRFSNTLCILANLISKGLGELRIVEYPDYYWSCVSIAKACVTITRRLPNLCYGS